MSDAEPRQGTDAPQPDVDVALPEAPVPGDADVGQAAPHDDGQAPLIIWNQRWEYDKNPAQLFDALYTISEEGLPFRLALCGMNFRRRPEEFEEARSRLSSHIIHEGYADEQSYHALLWQAQITVSTAVHEFFGVSVLEAIACHTLPILPHRLTYPELIPEGYHDQCLYRNQDELIQKLRWSIKNPLKTTELAAGLAATVSRFDWPLVAKSYDEAFARLLGEPL